MHTIPVSVIVPNYNSGRYLEDCIMSINSGQWPAEILIIDDCSTDDSLNLAIKLQSEFSNIRVLQREENGGSAAEARRLGISAAAQDWIALVDADDILETDALADAYAVVVSSDADICIWDLWRFDAEKKWRYDDANPKTFPKTGREAVLLTLGGWRIHPLGISRKYLYDNAYQGFMEKMTNADELLTRLVFNQATKVVGSQKRYFYRSNPLSTSRLLNVRQLSSLRSHLWLLEFSRRFPDAPVREMARAAISQSWFYWRHRKQVGNVETLGELRIVVPKISRLPELWSWLWRFPIYLIKLVILSVVVWRGTRLSNTEQDVDLL